MFIFEIMTLKFFLGRVKVDGTAPLRIRLKDGKRDTKITCPGIFINPKDWDKNFNMVNPKSPGADALNHEIKKYQVKTEDVKQKYLLGQIDFDLAKRMLSGSENSKSLREFINVVCRRDKTPETLRNYLNTVGNFTHHTGIEEPLFTDINFNNMMIVKNGVVKKGGSAATYNKYLRDIKAICNYAKRTKYIFHDFDFDKEWRAKEDITLKVKTITPEVIYQAISQVSIESKHRSARLKAFNELEAIGLWLLMFSMRGMYPADITSLSSHNLDYNFASRIRHEQSGKDSELNLLGNSHVYRHGRHKTGFPMKILVNLPPIRNLIGVLRFMLAASHPDFSFLSPEDAANPIYDDRLKGKDPKEVDFLKLFNFDKKKNAKVFTTVWGTYSSALSRVNMPSFKTARKTFSTTARRIRIDEGYVRTMLGQKDRSVSISYVDYDDPQLFAELCVSHIRVLRAFDTISLYNSWLRKIDEVFGSEWCGSDVYIKQNPDYVYSAFAHSLQPIIERNKTLIR